jgi:hypothetical protein
MPPSVPIGTADRIAGDAASAVPARIKRVGRY